MTLTLIKPPKADDARVVQLPVNDVERKARLATRIAGSVHLMGLNTCEINACVRIGLVCMDQGSTLIRAYDHAIKVAWGIISTNRYIQRHAEGGMHGR